MKAIKQRSNRPRKHKSPLCLEYLEDRVMLDATVIEDFSAGLDSYRTLYKFFPSAEVVAGAGHDGVSNALVKHDGFEWMIRNDGAVQVHRGETIGVWAKFADNVDGRLYFGFGSTPNGLTFSPYSQGSTLAFVLAGNTGELMIQANDSNAATLGFKRAPRTLGTVPQDYVANQWYYMEVVWGSDGTITGNLYDDVGNYLNTVSGSGSGVASGGIAFRGFGSDKYFDTVSVDNGGGAPGRGNFLPHHVVSHSVPTLHPVASTQPQPLQGGITGSGDGTGTVEPWNYTSVDGSGRDVELRAFNGLAMIPGTYDTSIPGFVALAAGNSSYNVGQVQIGWGPAHYMGTDVSQETPYLAQYMYRQLPGEATQLIGSSDLKHFWSSVSADYQFVNPGEHDEYGEGLNTVQRDFMWGSDMDPTTGEVHRFTYFSQGVTDVNGFNPEQNRNYSSRLEHMLQVRIADLDPSQNPDGTRWYLMGNLWLVGDDNVDNNSRWVEVTPHLSGTTFTFTYPSGTGGQLNFRTIPGLGAAPGPGGGSGGSHGTPIGDVSLARALVPRTTPAPQGLAGSIVTPASDALTNPPQTATLDQYFALSSQTGDTGLSRVQPQDNVPTLDPNGAVVQDPLQI